MWWRQPQGVDIFTQIRQDKASNSPLHRRWAVEFVLSEALIQDLARHRSRLSKYRLDTTFSHTPKWWQPVSVPHVREVAQSRLDRLFLHLGHQGYHQNKERVPIVEGISFVPEVAKAVCDILYLKPNKASDVLLARLVGELQNWLDRNDSRVALSKKRPRQYLELTPEKDVVIMITR